MEDIIYEEHEILEISKENDDCKFNTITKKVISEISLKIMVNGEELVSLLCLNQRLEELALGFLYSEGVINAFDDVEEITYNERMLAVIIRLRAGILVNRQESLRSITSGCGKCFTYINPLKQNQYAIVETKTIYSVQTILNMMKVFMKKSEIFKDVGGVHSVLFYTPEYQVLNEDIGRHNCFDKITGILLKDGKIDVAAKSVVFVSGRISSEIMTKIVRLGTPVLVSRSTPTSAAVRLAKQYHVTLLGYVRGDRGFVYTCPERLKT
ncbi:MAG: formate dehydrogenase accessory sulfurtransferase FdhD [Acetobacterium sp.]